MSFPDRNVAASAYKRCPSWTGYRALPSSPFETLALSSAVELVGVARPRCAGSVTRESDISNGENGDISIGDLHAAFAEARLRNLKSVFVKCLRLISVSLKVKD